MRTRLIRWLIFSVVVSLVPLLLAYASDQTRGGTPTLVSILSKGDLLLISTALAAAAIGDLLPAAQAMPVRAMLAGGGCVVSVLFGSSYYAAIVTGSVARPDLVADYSVALFGMTLLSGASCVLMAKATG